MVITHKVESENEEIWDEVSTKAMVVLECDCILQCIHFLL